MNAILQLVLATFMQPREIAAGMIAERFDRTLLWSGAALVIVLVGMVQFAVQNLTPVPETTPETEALAAMISKIFATPFLTTLIVGCGLIMSVFAIFLGGRMIGGTGDFFGTLAAMSWLQMVNAVTGCLVVVILAISPQLFEVASILSMVFNVMVFYATLHFIDVLHGFNSLWAAFGTMVISFIGLAIGLALILVLIGGAAAQTGAI